MITVCMCLVLIFSYPFLASGTSWVKLNSRLRPLKLVPVRKAGAPLYFCTIQFAMAAEGSDQYSQLLRRFHIATLRAWSRSGISPEHRSICSSASLTEAAVAPTKLDESHSIARKSFKRRCFNVFSLRMPPYQHRVTGTVCSNWGSDGQGRLASFVGWGASQVKDCDSAASYVIEWFEVLECAPWALKI